MKRHITSSDSRKNNPVAKHARKFNHSKQFVDRKKADKRGYCRFKQNLKNFQDDSKTIFIKVCSTITLKV